MSEQQPFSPHSHALTLNPIPPGHRHLLLRQGGPGRQHQQRTAGTRGALAAAGNALQLRSDLNRARGRAQLHSASGLQHPPGKGPPGSTASRPASRHTRVRPGPANGARPEASSTPPSLPRAVSAKAAPRGGRASPALRGSPGPRSARRPPHHPRRRARRRRPHHGAEVLHRLRVGLGHDGLGGRCAPGSSAAALPGRAARLPPPLARGAGGRSGARGRFAAGSSDPWNKSVPRTGLQCLRSCCYRSRREWGRGVLPA